jgi:phosphoserine phosphatase RsbU/P
MFLFTPSLRAGEVLHAFYGDAPSLFLGSAFVTAGLVAIAFGLLRGRGDVLRATLAFGLIRGKRDLLLINFGLFAALYGLRMWTQSRLFELAFPNFYLQAVLTYIIPIPFILYLRSAGLLKGIGRPAGYLLAVEDAALAVATLAFGPRHAFDVANSLLVIAAVSILMVQFLREKEADEDLVVVRRGLLVFAAFALWENLGQFYFHIWRVEPLGFLFFLICLGYVAARRSLQRDQQLSEIRKELDVARRIQLSILPAEFPPSSHFKVAVRYKPMTSVAGDFYDYIGAGNSAVGLLIADVSGHGVPAALIASMVKLAAASQREVADDPAKFLLGMNRVLHGNTQGQFVTAAYVYMDSTTGVLRYSAAGHPPMLLLHEGQVDEIAENGLMLGAFDFASYSTVSRAIEKGDRLLLYTDGLIEASNDAGEFYGQEALMHMLKKTATHPPAEAAEQIFCSVEQWSTVQQDDLTLLICDVGCANANNTDFTRGPGPTRGAGIGNDVAVISKSIE